MLLFNLQLFAHKKGVSSTKNGRDSNANVKLGKDDTLFATAEGRIAFERLGRDKRQVSVYPVNE